MMIQYLLDLNLKNKTILDMGCGTGILAIFAEIRGAKLVDAIDNDPWCSENSIENCKRNNCLNIHVFEGDASLLKGKKYDLIIANINRNILLNDISTYSKCLDEKGILLLSGFYKEDLDSIDKEAKHSNLLLDQSIDKNNWLALKYFQSKSVKF
jgi:ribosomal protein L11 methyltransferase